MLDQSRELNMLACLLFALASGSFARFHCDVFLFFFCAMSSIFFLSLQAQKQFRYAARFVFTLTTTEQLQTQAMRAAYPHLATFAPYGLQ